MPKSMTGYARCEKITDSYRIQCELKSLNSRYFTVDIQSPSFMFGRENQLIDSVKEFIKRGKVSLRIFVEFLSPSNAVKIDTGLAKSYYDALESLVNELGIPEPVNLDNLLRFKDLIRFELSQQQEKEIFSLIEEVLKCALAELNRDRSNEGSKLAGDLLAILDQIKDLCERVSNLAESMQQKIKEKIIQDVRKLLSDEVQLNDTLLENSVAFLVQRADIREELTRLASHVEKAVKLLSSDEPVGNHLDFLAQEMLREVNTILSKSQSQEISDFALKMKVLVSQFREQVQNIE